MNKARYTQAQINDMCIVVRSTEKQISDLSTNNKNLIDLVDKSLRVTTEGMTKITEF